MPGKSTKKTSKKKTSRKKATARKTVRKVRCKGKTQDGKRCKRMVTPPAKFCYLHSPSKKKKKK